MLKGFSMKKMGVFLGVALWGVLLASCASNAKNCFGPYSAAETFYKQGNYSKAIGKYQEYLALNPQGTLAATAEYYIAKSYLVSGDPAKAREGFTRVTEKFPGTSWAAFAEEQLEILSGAAKA